VGARTCGGVERAEVWTERMVLEFLARIVFASLLAGGTGDAQRVVRTLRA
jgi:hypothetical protein